MLTPLNQQLDQSPQAPPMVAKPEFGNPATPYVPPTTDTPTQGIGAQMAAQGRGPDSMLVHMAPEEVKGLQQLAMSQGGSLTINPQTGLPEAGFLKKMLPMLIGAALTPLTGGIINPMTAGAIVGAGYGLATGNLKKGLMAGLSAYGGAGLGSALAGAAGFGGIPAVTNALGGTAASKAATLAASEAAAGASSVPVAAQAAATAAPTAGGIAEAVGQYTPNFAGAAEIPMAAAPAAKDAALQEMIKSAAAREAALTPAAPTGLRALGSSYADALHRGVPGMVPRMVTTGLGTAGIMSTLNDVATPKAPKYKDQDKPSNYAGPYLPALRKYTPPEPGSNPNDSSEHQYFDNVNPFPAYTTASGGAPPGYPGAIPLSAAELADRKKQLGYATGGLVSLKPGGFVLNAETTNAVGEEGVRRLGGQMIRGPGTGTSDSIPAKIDGKRPARVSNGEAKLGPKAVKKIGGGDRRKGAQKLYAMMDQARQGRAA